MSAVVTSLAIQVLAATAARSAVDRVAHSALGQDDVSGKVGVPNAVGGSVVGDMDANPVVNTGEAGSREFPETLQEAIQGEIRSARDNHCLLQPLFSGPELDCCAKGMSQT